MLKTLMEMHMPRICKPHTPSTYVDQTSRPAFPLSNQPEPSILPNIKRLRQDLYGDGEYQCVPEYDNRQHERHKSNS